MSKILSSRKLREEIVEAIVVLAACTPLYSIRLADICDAINEKYRLTGKKKYLSGSIMAALDGAVRASLETSDVNYARQFKRLEQVLIRSEKNRENKVGRWRRTTLHIYFLAFEYVWQQMIGLRGIFQLDLSPIVKLKLITEEIIGFKVCANISSEAMKAGMEEIFFVETTMPIGFKKTLPDGKGSWVEPINPFWAKFSKALDALIADLQQDGIFDSSLSVPVIRQSIIGSMIWQRLGKILAERSKVSLPEKGSFFKAVYSLEQSMAVMRRFFRSFCPNGAACQLFDKDWP